MKNITKSAHHKYLIGSPYEPVQNGVKPMVNMLVNNCKFDPLLYRLLRVNYE